MLYVLKCNVIIIPEKEIIFFCITENDAIFEVTMHLQPSKIPDSEKRDLELSIQDKIKKCCTF